MQPLMQSQRSQFMLLALIVFTLLLLLKVSLASAASSASIWYVDGSVASSLDGMTPQTPLKTIEEATQQANAGDQIQVAAGVYTGQVHLSDGIALLGTGYQSTTLQGDGVNIVVRMEHGSIISGFTILGSDKDFWDAGVSIAGGGVTVSHNRITANSKGIVADDCDTSDACLRASQITFNIIDHNFTQGIFVGEQDTAMIRNNTVVSNTHYGIVAHSKGSLIENNIVVLHDSGSINTSGKAIARNNAIYNFGLPYPTNDLQIAPFQVDPLFQNFAQIDYRLSAGSPLRGVALSPTVDLGALPFVADGIAPTALAITTTQGSYSWRVTWLAVNGRQTRLYLRNHRTNRVERIEPGATDHFVLRNLPAATRYSLTASSSVPNGAESDLSERVEIDVPPLVPGVYQESSAALAFSGQWHTNVYTGTETITEFASEHSGDQLEFAFVGESVAITRSVRSSGGKAKVFVDDKFYDEIESHFPLERFQVPIVIDQLGPGTHRLTLLGNGKYLAIDAIQVPAPYSSDEQQNLALNRVNRYRKIVNLPAVNLATALNLAAQAHANYMRINGVSDGVVEKVALPGFIGEHPGQRAAYFGYSTIVAEVLQGADDPAVAVDRSIATIYQRKVLLDYFVREMGYAMVAESDLQLDVLDMGLRSAFRQPPLQRLIYTYPAHQQKDVPTTWDGIESPDPLPAVNEPVGYPISLYLIQPEAAGIRIDQQPGEAQKWELRQATLSNSAGEKQETYIIDVKSDPDNTHTDQVNLIAKTPLAPGETYTARFVGFDSRAKEFDHTITFTTQSQPITYSIFLPTVLAE